MIMNKACELEDFDNEELLSCIRTYLPSPSHAGEQWPRGHEDRKLWEIAMSIIAAQRHVGQGRREVALGIGAGKEATTFILTNLFKQVIATDLYGGDWSSDAPRTMIYEPERFAQGVKWRVERLSVRHMDARDMRMEDGSVDFIYSSSSLEHFGTLDEISAAVREMTRVLRVGGVISLSTELLLTGQQPWLNENTYLFTESVLNEAVIQASHCLQIGGQKCGVSETTLRHETSFIQALSDLRTDRGRLGTC